MGWVNLQSELEETFGELVQVGNDLDRGMRWIQNRATRLQQMREYAAWYRKTARGRAAIRAYQRAHKTQRRVYSHRYYVKRRREILAKTRAYERTNRERVNARVRAWRAANPERVREQRRRAAKRKDGSRPYHE